jgi:hypothetical protein
MAANVGAILLGVIFLVSGGWKVLSPFQTGELLEQAQVPGGWGPLGATALGTLELLAALLLFLPKYRRLGGILGSALMIFFIGWVSFYYPKLVGHECSCFPIIKRTVGPGFFISDAVMLLFGLAAWAWSARVASLRIPASLLVGLAALAGVSFGVNAATAKSSNVPNPVIVDGKPADLRHGKVFLYFYDPECSHCDAAAKFMSKLDWADTNVVAIPTHDPQFAKDFLHDTHLKAGTSLEIAKLRNAFKFVDPPYGVALVDGQVKATYPQSQFNEPLPAPDLRKLGFVR